MASEYLTRGFNPEEALKPGRVYLTDGPPKDSIGYAQTCRVCLGEEKRGLPTDAKARKKIPLHSGLVKYFPDALIAVAELSFIGNEQHNPGQPLHWSREKSSDHEDTLLRHHWEAGTLDSDGVRHSTKRAWRALAALQLEIERDAN